LRRFKEIQVAQAEATKEIKETKKKLESLKQDTDKKPDADTTGRPGLPDSKKADKIVAASARQEKITLLERKLVVLLEKITDLERMKKKLAAERRKRRLLKKAVEEKKKTEKALVAQLRKGSTSPPVIVIASPRGESEVGVNLLTVTGVVEDDNPLASLEIFVNGEPVKPETNRGIAETGKKAPERAEFKARVRLIEGVNRILVKATGGDGLVTEERLTVRRMEEKTNIWAVVIGIDAYPNVRKLKYAVKDARLVRAYLSDQLGVRPENMVVLLNREATLMRIKSALGTDIKNKAGQNDMVLIFFAGHGATEKDVTSPDGDGLEKYLLPYDADPRDLYATALPMDEISKVFRRIRSERLVFIADACYSGASGGRTVGISGVRANLSDHFLERIASGKGRIILTASGANEVSTENDALQHGVFTYYLVEGLKGTADRDRDGLITVSEAYQYVSEQVPRATDLAQHPVKKGAVEGRLIIGIAEGKGGKP
jgi:hypothetical protein